MSEPSPPPPIPLLGDVPLTGVTWLRHEIDGRFTAIDVAGLDGEVLQRAGRGGHRIHLRGFLHGDAAVDDLATLQEAASSGEEISFAADMTAALELQSVVITAFRAEAAAGHPDRFTYEIEIAESPPLPPPAEVEGFGGLDGFGLGDLGFDTDLLGDLAALAGDVMGAVESALEVLGALEALAGLQDLSLQGAFAPLDEAVTRISGAGRSMGTAVTQLGRVFGA